MVNLADAVPAATVTVPGTLAVAGLLLASVITTPPVGAGPVRVTVPVDGVPPETVVGFNARLERAGGITVIVACLIILAKLAVMITAVRRATGVVEIVKVAAVLPDATVTLTGTDAAEGMALDRVTVRPPEGAFPVSVTVPVAVLPPVTELGLRVRDERAGGFTVTVAFLLEPLAMAVITTAVLTATGVVVIVNDANVLPAPMVTFAGTLATDGFALERVTTKPPAGAA